MSPNSYHTLPRTLTFEIYPQVAYPMSRVRADMSRLLRTGMVIVILNPLPSTGLAIHQPLCLGASIGSDI